MNAGYINVGKIHLDLDISSWLRLILHVWYPIPPNLPTDNDTSASPLLTRSPPPLTPRPQTRICIMGSAGLGWRPD